ncbi:cupin [candidate division Kazan bacterium RIFCSPHIGHO2_01_FULL_44_14]|uniref:Cupin n=1 Tax=candidate division Kazan bacterium RIFCSPLOWO2_01_FULL_45_19 TaxID=1798538 RepID=A0A1F4NPI6_UNCK3|nr:MAG: cupin [candidate division Kazan bacterium RIFCSPLOWO2_01_FULL_45_19]OGB77620.1 MAG: cupin [candidate division Kazan bacterium RIFCSPHIGHO2_01_FULL_44_14]
MRGYHDNIEKMTLANTDFRRVLYTGHHTQLVLMTLKPGEEIGAEVHPNIDQFFRFEAGSGQVVIDDNTYQVADGDAVIVPAGSNHNVINMSSVELKLYTLYSPPEHINGTVRVTKADAIARPEEFDGKTTE